MFRFACALLIFLAIILTVCTSSQPETGSTPTQAESTASVSTVEPVIITPSLPKQTPVPALPGGLSPTELKYSILAEFPDFFFCDPDYYPVSRDDEFALALQRFPELQANSEEFNAILAHNSLSGKTAFSDEEKLLVYREHKKLSAIQLVQSGDAYQFQITVAETEGEGELITVLIDGQGSITIVEKATSIATCPICLAAGTLIDTPAGPVPVQSLRPGMPVWTLDAAGRRVARPLLQVGSTIVAGDHQVVHLVLDDGREIWVSPGHPTADGLTAGELRAGDYIDGGSIVSVQLVRYAGFATYDLLPDGDTGLYWANGILLASTLDPLAP